MTMTNDKLRAAIEQPLWAKSNLTQNHDGVGSPAQRCAVLSSVFVIRRVPASVPIGACQRQTAAAVIRLEQQSLIHVQRSLGKSVGRSRQEQSPHAIVRLANHLQDLVTMKFQTARPVAQRERIVLAQAFYVPNFEASRFGVTQRGIDGHQIAIGKDVTSDKGRTLGSRFTRPQGNAVI